MTEIERKVSFSDRGDYPEDIEWLDTKTFAARVGRAAASVTQRLAKKGVAGVKDYDSRIVAIEQRDGKGRTGRVWMFGWSEAGRQPGTGAVKVGYFSIAKGEPDDVIKIRNSIIAETARKLGMPLRGIFYDDYRHQDNPAQLASIMRDGTVNCIITDREFSLGARNASFARSLLEMAGISVVISPTQGRDSTVVKLNYMDEICRLLIALTLLGEDVDDLTASARRLYKEMRNRSEVDSLDTGIT
jgi:hypothetical protein